MKENFWIIPGVHDLLVDLKLHNYVLEIRPYVPEVIREFYANLDSSMLNTKSEHSNKVFVRGQFVNFSYAIIDSANRRDLVSDFLPHFYAGVNERGDVPDATVDFVYISDEESREPVQVTMSFCVAFPELNNEDFRFLQT